MWVYACLYTIHVHTHTRYLVYGIAMACGAWFTCTCMRMRICRHRCTYMYYIYIYIYVYTYSHSPNDIDAVVSERRNLLWLKPCMPQLLVAWGCAHSRFSRCTLGWDILSVAFYGFIMCLTSFKESRLPHYMTFGMVWQHET
jgi:hypothetical protein